MRFLRLCRLAPVFLAGMQAFLVAGPNEGLIFGVDDPKRVGRGESVPGDEGGGLSLPYSQILRDTEPPYENIFRDVRVGGRSMDKAGPADVFTQARLFSGPRMNVPLASRGVRPEDAEFKLGRFYLDLRALSASLLYSDNVNLSETDRNDGLIGIVRLTGVAVFQITDNLRLATRGTLVWLPFRSEFGVSGFGVDDPMVEFETEPLFQTQLTLDQNVKGWDVECYDDLRIRHRRFGAGWGFDVFNGETFDEEDRIGHYVFRDRTPPPTSGGGGENRNDRFGYNYIEGRNLVGASAGRLLPTTTRLEFGGNHADYWYTGTRYSQLPGRRDMVYAMLDSERETLRFKPFARYRASHYDYNDGWGEEAVAGVHGPVTENLDLRAEGGFYWRTDSDHNTYLARLRLRHSFNPLTYHELQFHRGVTEPIEEIADSVSYLLRHIFRDDLTGQFCASWARFEETGTGRRTGEERRAAVRLSYDLAQHTSLRLSGAYADFRNEDEQASDFEQWIGRWEIYYRHSHSLETRLIYQYWNRRSDTPGASYWENLVTVSVIKYF